MPAEALMAFLGVAVLVTVTPGQDMALVLRNTLMSSRHAGIVTGAGVVSGLMVWAAVASAGLAAVLLSSQPLFEALKLAGALYLIYLALQSLRAALDPSSGAAVDSDPAFKRRLSDGIAYRQGLLSNLGNPKVAIFYSSLLPQFVGPSASFGALLALGLLHCLIAALWLIGYAAALDRLGAYLRESRVRRAIEAVTGVVLLGLALRLATVKR